MNSAGVKWGPAVGRESLQKLSPSPGGKQHLDLTQSVRRREQTE